MKAHEFWRWCDSQMPDNPHADVVVADEDGFIHVVESLFWDVDDTRWVIKSRWQPTQDDRGFPAQ